MIGRFFQGLQQGIGGADRHAVGFVDHADLPIPDQRPINELMLDFTDLFDPDLRIGLFRIRSDACEVGMGLRIDLTAAAAHTASVHRRGARAAVAEQGLRETRCEQALADAIRSMKEIGMREPVAGDRCLQESFGPIMADDVCERHRLSDS